MTYVADLHLHSHFARGTSKDLSFENLARWAKIKGINLLASADFTHPAWFLETARKLRETGDGLYEYDGVRFVLGTELNCVAELRGRHRRVHLLVLAPSLDVCKRINAALSARGNLESDGRPTIRIAPKELVYTLLEIDRRCLVVPAHAWTPWFGIFGSKSGFDSLEECFEDAVDHIYAVETGLSSDPAMNWRIPELDSRSIVSFSDAHSLPKMGRELTVFEGELSYQGLFDALKTQSIAYTVEFFPQEGKYHHSGHRKCGVSYSPEDVVKDGRRCPACGRPLTLGVMQRVEELATRDVVTWRDETGLTVADNGRPPYRMLVALNQIIAEGVGVGINSKRVRAEYVKLAGEFGDELAVLADAPVADIATVAGDRIAQGIDRVRRGDIFIEPGYDGLYGTAKVLPDRLDGPATSRPSR